MSSKTITFFVFLMLAAVNAAFSQCPMQLADLDKALNYSVPEFEKYAAKKGFTNRTPGNANGNIALCVCIKYKTENTKDKINRDTDPGGSATITYLTTDQAIFEKIKSQAIKSNYKFVQELPFSVDGIATRQYLYTNQKRIVSFYSYTDKNAIAYYAVYIH